MAERFLVTGALGCIGAWILRQFVADGVEVVAVDSGGSDHRVVALVGPDWRERLVFEQADVSDAVQVERIFERNEPTNVIHLAALQVPACRADPVLGATVNVVGTVSLFEAARRAGLGTPVAFASSVAAYDQLDGVEGVAGADPSGHPSTHYGVYKWANEGTARVYWLESGVRSIGLRPYVVYGVGRDHGMTSEPTKAMAAAARGEGHRIPYSGRSQLQYAPDVAAAFVAATRSAYAGSTIVNVPGEAVTVAEIVATIEDLVPAVSGKIEIDDQALPFPEVVDTSAFEEVVGTIAPRPLRDGIAETIELLR